MMRIGLLGASRIAPNAIIAPARSRRHVQVSAVAASDPHRATAFARTYAVPGVAATYSELAQRDDVDVIYCALPPGARMDPCLAALAAGKMLLVEKPFAVDAQAAATLRAAAQIAGRPAIEAFHYRFHSMFNQALNIVENGALGGLRRVRGEFSVPIARAAGELRWEAKAGGGAIMDLGCYPLHAFRTLLGGEGEVMSAWADWVEGIDARLEASIAFGEVIATMRCSMVDPAINFLEIEGTAGSLRLDSFVAPHVGGTMSVAIGDNRFVRPASGATTYEAQLDHVLAVFRGDAIPLTGGEDAVANMRLIDDCRRAAGLGS